jgi:single-strand DNA-binding protein
MNRIILLGRLTKDPEVRYTPSGKVVCQFTLAVDRPFSNQEGQREADFIPVVIWGKQQAETCGNSLTKGQRTLVEGRLQIRTYDGKDGNRHWVTEVIADRFEFIERRSDVANARPSAPSAPAAPQQGNSGMDGFGSSVPFDEEIPF